MSLFSRNIRTLREKAGLKLSDFEQYGIKIGTMSNYELGKTEPKLETVIFFSNFFRININLLLFRDLEILYKVEKGEQLSNEELLQYQLEKQQISKDCHETTLLPKESNNSLITEKNARPKCTPKMHAQNIDLHAQNAIPIMEECQIEYRKVLDGQNKEFKAERGDEQHGIPLIPITAIAGPGAVVFSDLFIEQYYVIPELKNAEFMIRMKGNSMYPKYHSGDVLACIKVLNLTFFQWNKVYAIYTESQGVMIKRVHEGAGMDTIKLVSDNPSYPAFEVSKDEITAIALVIGCVRCE